MTNDANSMTTEDKINSNMTFWHMLKGLWPYARKHPLMLGGSLLSIVGVALTSRLLPTIIGYAVDHGIQEKNAQLMAWAAIAFLVVEVLHAVMLFCSQYLFNWFGNRMLFYVREDLVRHTQNLTIDYFNRTPLGRIVTRLTNDTATLGEVFTNGVIELFTSFVVVLSIVVAMLLISWKLTLVTLGFAPVFIYLAYQITEKIRVILRDSKKRLSILTSFIAENLTGIKIIQLFYRVDRNQQKFNSLSRSYRDISLESIRHYAILQPVMNLFNAATITAALYYGGLLNHENSIGLGALIAFLMHAQDFIHPLRDILEKYQQFQNSLTSAERVFQLMEEPVESASGITQNSPWVGKVEFRNLTFRYRQDLPIVLEGINLQIQKGQSIAIVGRTGSGKSTLISLLQRFYEAPANSIYIDDQDIESIPRKTLRSKLGVVQQDNFIFRGNIAENVSLCDSNISEERIRWALDQVGYLRLIERSGRGLYSAVEEKGANLSVGERQLLAFARILAFSPEILVLDEATANIDSESEKLIQNATQKIIKGRTSIIIAHRLSTIRECDKIVVLDQGRIKEMGSHDELVRQHGLYAQLAVAGVNETLITS